MTRVWQKVGRDSGINAKKRVYYVMECGRRVNKIKYPYDISIYGETDLMRG